jgi:hypothetical protein
MVDTWQFTRLLLVTRPILTAGLGGALALGATFTVGSLLGTTAMG